MHSLYFVNRLSKYTICIFIVFICTAADLTNMHLRDILYSMLINLN